jgi:hypothetical protein
MKKNLVLVMMISLFLNGFVPRYSFFSQEYDTFFNLVGNQPLLQYYFSLSTIPVTIVEKLFLEKTCHTTKPQSQPKKTGPTSNTSAEFSIAVTEQKGIVRSHGPLLAGGGSASTHTPAIGALTSLYDRIDSYSRSQGAGGNNIYLLLILMFLIMLPRGSLGDGYWIRYHTILGKNPVWRNSKLGFSFGGKK